MSKSLPALQVEALSKSFADPKGKKFLAIDKISFAMQQGEILGLLGPNGAGKTTTIQMLLSVLAPSAGQISYFGKDLAKYRSEVLQDVAFASTYIDFPWRLTVGENLDVYARLYGLSRQERAKRSHKFLEFFGIEDKKDVTMGQLSAGQRTRVMLCKAFLAYPKVVLLDEPTASLDPDIAVQVRQFVLEQRQNYGVSVLFTSHNMAEVAEICDRVMFLQAGKIVADDTPQALVAQMKQVTVRLNVGDGLKRSKQVCSQLGLSISADSQLARLVTIELEEQQIARLLNELAKKGVEYSQISVLKPNLEDYFLQLAGVKK